jgi:PKD-like domain
LQHADAAERLEKVGEKVGTEVLPLKTFTFGAANSGSNLMLGKLRTAIRHNRLPSGSRIDVTETYDYSTASGQMSKRTTKVENVTATGRTTIQELAYTTAYDDLGLPGTIGLPACTNGGCPDGAIPTLTLQRTNGLLTSVAGFGSLSYDPSGMVAKVTHLASGAAVGSDTYQPSYGMPRPGQIRFEDVSSCPSPAIAALDTICPGDTGRASVPARDGVTHQWQITGGTITSSTTGDTVTFQASAGASTVKLTVTSSLSCAPSPATKTISVTTQPAPSVIDAPPSVCANSSGNEASVAPRPGFTHTWSISGGTITSSTTGDRIVFTAQSAPVTLTVTASGGCGTASQTRTIATAGAPTAKVMLPGTTDKTISIVRGSGQTVTLSVELRGEAPWRLQWNDGIVETVSDYVHTRTVTPTSSTDYSLLSVSSGGCGGTVTGQVTVNIVPPPPAWVRAEASGGPAVSISWAAVDGAESYLLQRTTTLGSTTSVTRQVWATSSVDSPPATGVPVTYVYYVLAVQNGYPSLRGAFDHATVGTSLWSQTITPRETRIRGTDIQELRAAIDAVRKAFNHGAAFPGSVVPSGAITPASITALVDALAPARATAGYPPFAFRDVTPPEKDKLIRAEHIRQLRDAVH